MFDELPLELKFKILSHLPAETLCRLETASKDFQELANDEVLWKELYRPIYLYGNGCETNKKTYKSCISGQCGMRKLEFVEDFHLYPDSEWRFNIDIICQFTFIKKLTLYRLGIKSIPDSISKLYQLTELNIHNNYLYIFPMGICKLEKLEILNLSHTKLASVPDEIGNLKLLKELNISHILISILPNGIRELELLEDLNISHTNISNISILDELKNLKYLLIYNSPINADDIFKFKDLIF
jgi:hypothetical protein